MDKQPKSALLIEKTRKKIFYYTATILMVIFVLIILSRVVILHEQNIRETNAILHYAIATPNEEYNSDKEFILYSKQTAKIYFYTTTDNNNNYYISIDYPNSEYDSDIFTPADIETHLKHAIEKSFAKHESSGNYNNVYYMFESTEVGSNLFCVIDRSVNIKENNALIIGFTILLAIVYLVLILIIHFATHKLIKPVKEVFYAQQEFVSNASHELKTPLTIISANADVIDTNGQNKEWVDNIKTQTKRMNSLITDMITLSKLEENKLNKVSKNFNLSTALDTSALPFEAVAFEKNKQMIFDIEESINYVGCENDYKQIVSILVDNAVKYADEKGLIKISLNKKGKTYLTIISNTGCNFNPLEKDKLFERFYRGDTSHESSTIGSGLGLSIAKTLADNNGWKLEIDAKENLYTSFILKM